MCIHCMSTCMFCFRTCRAVWVHYRARVGYAAFDAQLWKRICHYTVLYVCLCVRKHVYAGLRACCVSSRPVLVIRVHTLQNNLGNALVCPGLQAPMFRTGVLNVHFIHHIYHMVHEKIHSGEELHVHVHCLFTRAHK